MSAREAKAASLAAMDGALRAAVSEAVVCPDLPGSGPGDDPRRLSPRYWELLDRVKTMSPEESKRLADEVGARIGRFYEVIKEAEEVARATGNTAESRERYSQRFREAWAEATRT